MPSPTRRLNHLRLGYPCSKWKTGSGTKQSKDSHPQRRHAVILGYHSQIRRVTNIDRLAACLAFRATPPTDPPFFASPAVYGAPGLPNDFLHEYVFSLRHPTPRYYAPVTASTLGLFWTFDDHIDNYPMTPSVSHHPASPSMDSRIALSLLFSYTHKCNQPLSFPHHVIQTPEPFVYCMDVFQKQPLSDQQIFYEASIETKFYAGNPL